MLYGAILAIGEELIDRVPYKVQLDWEAMFTPNPVEFVERVLPWISNRRPATLPVEMMSTHENTHENPSIHTHECIMKGGAMGCHRNTARVSEVFDTLRDIVQAMNAIGEFYYTDILKNSTVDQNR